jgi:hypothetical protein
MCILYWWWFDIRRSLKVWKYKHKRTKFKRRHTDVKKTKGEKSNSSF